MRHLGNELGESEQQRLFLVQGQVLFQASSPQAVEHFAGLGPPLFGVCQQQRVVDLGKAPEALARGAKYTAGPGDPGRLALEPGTAP
ncbi:hypothetical protein ADK64_35535 [Streptomyces sp. MMG1121]|nr:hypothetical protein ADK64_35535 [Streptomyces sp. MMG1121]